MKFYNRISEVCKKHKKVALFVDMDGTIVEYSVFPDGFVTTETKEVFLNAEPLEVVLNNLKKVRGGLYIIISFLLYFCYNVFIGAYTISLKFIPAVLLCLVVSYISVFESTPVFFCTASLIACTVFDTV